MGTMDGTAMTGAPIVDDDSKLITEPPANLDGWIGRLMSEQIGPSVYATHWQMRAGFFNRIFKLPNTVSIGVCHQKPGLPGAK
jgi:hypothetical protein